MVAGQIHDFVNASFDYRDFECSDRSLFEQSYDMTEVVFVNFTTATGTTTLPILVSGMSDWEEVFNQFNATCLDEDGFIAGINVFVYVFIGIAVGVFTFAYLEISLFQTACERQVKKIRLAFYKAILRQEVGWFDANPSGELASRIAE